MALGDSPPPGRGDVVQFGRPRRPRPRWLGSVLVASLVVAAVVTVVVTRPGGGVRKPQPPPPVTVTDIGRPILRIRAGYELFGLDSSGLVAVQFARGRVVHTALPPLQNSGPVSFVAATGEVIVRPLDNVPGYVVPDGKPARRLTGVLAHGGILLPGPHGSREWFDRYDPGTLELIGPDGKPERIHLATPSGRVDAMAISEASLPGAPQPPLTAMADGRGGVILVDSGNVRYDVGAGLLRPVGALIIAVGPTRWLGMSCQHGHCRDVVISAASGASRPLPGPLIAATPWTSPPGAITPDGSTAAVVITDNHNAAGSLEFVNLSTGSQTVVDVAMGPPSSGQLAWSPDSRWLFVVTAAGKLAAVDARTGHVRELGLDLSGLRQIAMRPAIG